MKQEDLWHLTFTLKKYSLERHSNTKKLDIFKSGKYLAVGFDSPLQFSFIHKETELELKCHIGNPKDVSRFSKLSISLGSLRIFRTFLNLELCVKMISVY